MISTRISLSTHCTTGNCPQIRIELAYVKNRLNNHLSKLFFSTFSQSIWSKNILSLEWSTLSQRTTLATWYCFEYMCFFKRSLISLIPSDFDWEVNVKLSMYSLEQGSSMNQWIVQWFGKQAKSIFLWSSIHYSPAPGSRAMARKKSYLYFPNWRGRENFWEQWPMRFWMYAHKKYASLKLDFGNIPQSLWESLLCKTAERS